MTRITHVNDAASLAKTLTDAQVRVLEAVSVGKVTREYRGDGNVIIGAHSATVREMEQRKLIIAKKFGGGFFDRRDKFELSAHARGLLDDLKKSEQNPVAVIVRLTRDQCRLLAAAAEFLLSGMMPWTAKERRGLEAVRRKLEEAQQ